MKRSQTIVPVLVSDVFKRIKKLIDHVIDKFIRENLVFSNIRNKNATHTFTKANSKVTAEICSHESSQRKLQLAALLTKSWCS